MGYCLGKRSFMSFTANVDCFLNSSSSTPLTSSQAFQPAELRRKGATLSLARRAMELHSVLMFTECKCTASQIETPICLRRTTTNHSN